MAHRWGLLSGALLFTPACSPSEESRPAGPSGGAGGGSSASGGVGSATGGTAGAGGFDEYLRLVVEARCSAVFGCAELRKDTVLELLDGVEGCEAFMRRVLGQSHLNRELARLVANGSVILRSDRLPACLEQERSCLLTSGVEYTACREVFAGTVPLGGSCYLHQECAGDAYCLGQMDANGQPAICPGTCTARGHSLCTSVAECTTTAPYAVCVWSLPTQPYCLDVNVIIDAGPGAPCGDTAPGEFTVCRSDLWCGGVGTTVDTCQAVIPAGGGCENDFDVCASGYFCASSAAPASCQPVTVVQEAGVACSNATLTLCSLVDHLLCVNGQCQYAGDGSAGTQCGTDTSFCNDGLFCDEARTCQPQRAAGEACTGDASCQSGRCSDLDLCEERFCGVE